VAVIVALHHARVQGLAEGEGRALAFTMLVVGNLSLVLSNRSWSRGLISTLRQPNRTLGGFFAAALGILALTLYVPFFARLFRFEELGALDLAVVAGGGVFCLLWCELLKSFRARMERAPRGRPG
jgi:Ca2+-transporting ATPase